jgi:uncharacterized protein YecE (DUF72 family)
MKRKDNIHIGTSGWHYKHWRGTFYPMSTKDKEQLKVYLETFQTVEINNSFYRLPESTTFEQWRKSTPENFIFSVKASRFITHMKKLKDTYESLQTFLKNANALKEKLGPILFQLPPGWKINSERLSDFLKQLPKGYRYAFEFRNHTWYEEEVFTLLRKYNCAFCIYELDHHISPMEITANFVYLRLHGPEGKYQGSYDQHQLSNWAKLCRKWSEEEKEVFVYFDNDQLGYAGFNAQSLKNILKI